MAYTEVDTGTYAGSGATIRTSQGPQLTPSAGAITVTDSFHSINGGTISTINGGVANSLYILKATSTFHFSAPTNILSARADVLTGTVVELFFDGSNFIDLADSVQMNVLKFGAKGDGTTDDHAAIQAAIDATSTTANATLYFPPTANGYLCKSPLVVNKNFMTLAGAGYYQTVMLFDLSAYAGSYPSYYIILGDSLSTPDANVTSQGNCVRDMRIVGTGGTGAILAWRSTNSKIENVSIVGTSLTYGIRVVASDSRFRIMDCNIGNSNAASAPSIAISIENGSNQTVIEGCIALGGTTCIQVFNSVGTQITNNLAIGAWVGAASSYYGIRIRNDQAVPAYLTWINANVGGNIQITNNWFEPNDHAGATIYDIFVGDGSPTVHAITGTVVRDNFFLASSSATRYNVHVDYADQTVVDTVAYWGTVTKLLNVTSHATLTKYDIQTQSAYNTTSTAESDLIADAGSKSTTMGHWKTPAFSAGNFTSSSGTWVVGSGDVVTFAYSTFPRRLSLSVYLVTTDVTGTPNELRVTVPDGYTVAKTTLAMARIVNSGAAFSGMAIATAGNTYVSVYKIDQANFAADAGGTGVQFQIEMETQ